MILYLLFYDDLFVFSSIVFYFCVEKSLEKVSVLLVKSLEKVVVVSKKSLEKVSYEKENREQIA